MTESDVEGSWHVPQVNRHNVWRSYVDSYGNHAFGILQEDCQNSFDAYSSGADPREMKVIIHYDAQTRRLSHRDFGTLGMAHCRHCAWGILPNGQECTNTDCPWGCFHNMGYSGKGGANLGSRGMGKSLHLLAGTRTFVRTTLPDGKSQASVWEREAGGKDWRWRLAAEPAKPLSCPGTEFVTEGIIGPVNDQLLEVSEVVAELQDRWFRLLSQGATIEYIVSKGGPPERHLVREPAPPPLDESQGVEKATRVDPEVVVTYQGTRLGALRNLHVFMAKEPFPEGSRRAGIAIVKNGKQTLQRFVDFPEDIPDSIRARIFGYCDAECTAAEPFLREAENAQHTGYQWSHPTYKAVRRVLRDVAKQFSAPFLRAGGERVTEAEQTEARDILDLFNKALGDVPEFGFFGKESTFPSRHKILTSTKNYIYLSRLDFENKSYKRGEKATVSAVLKNPTPKTVSVTTVFQHFDPTPIVVQLTPDSAIVPSGTPESPGTATTSFQVFFDPSQAPGIHWVQVALQDVTSAALLDDEGQPIIARRHIYCEFEPRKLTRTRSGTGQATSGQGTGGGEGSLGLSGLQYFKKPEMRDSMEVYIDQTQAVVFINLKGRRFEFAREGAKSKRIYWPVAGELISEELLKLKAQLDAGEREQWTAEEVKNEVLELEAGKAKLVRRMVELAGD
nr:hypothetical protein [Ferrimicrobium acidiphilum]